MYDFTKLDISYPNWAKFGYDGIKYRIDDVDYESFIKRHCPDDIGNLTTGEIKFTTLNDGPLTIKVIYPNKGDEPYLMINGSIHSYSNYLLFGQVKEEEYHNLLKVKPNYQRPTTYLDSYSTNYNEFNLQDTKGVLDYISDLYNIDLKKGHFKNLEFNITFQTTFNPTDAINENIILHAEKLRTNKKTYGKKGTFIEFETTDFWLKIYDKGLQNELGYYLFRIELKFRTSRAIKKLGIESLSDLLNPQNKETLINKLLDQINKLTIVDAHILPENASQKERETFNTFLSEQKIKVLRAKYRRNRNKIGTAKDEFKDILNRYGLDKIKKEILDQFVLKQTDKYHQDYNQVKQEELTNTTIHISGICHLPSKKYNKRSKEEIPISDVYEIKKPRNNESNPRNNLRGAILKIVSQPLLFGVNEIITLSDDQIKKLEYWKDTDYDILDQLGL